MQLPAEALGNPFLSARQVEETLCPKWNWIKRIEEMKWKGKKKKQEERQAKFQKECEEAIYGGSYPDDKVKHDFTTAYVKDGGQTRAVVGDGKPVLEQVMVEETGAVEAGLNSRDWPEEQERKLVAELRRQWIETSEQLRQEGKDTVGGLDLGELGQRLEQAFSVEEDEGVGSRESGVGEEAGVVSGETEEEERESGLGSRESEDRPSSSPTPDSPLPTPDDPSSSPTPDSPLPTPEDTPDLHEVTATAWDRARFLEWWSRWERREMKAILQRTGGEDARDPGGAAGSVPRLQEDPVPGPALRGQTARRAVPVSERLYGEDPGFERPSPVWTDPELYQQMMNDMEGGLGES